MIFFILLVIYSVWQNTKINTLTPTFWKQKIYLHIFTVTENVAFQTGRWFFWPIFRITLTVKIIFFNEADIETRNNSQN